MGKNPKGNECGTVTGIGKQDHLRHRKVNAPFRVLTKHAESAQLTLRFVRRDEKAGKAPGAWRVHQPYNGNLKVSSCRC